MKQEDATPRATRERQAFSELLEVWARDFDAKTVLEGPLDGADGPVGIHAIELAKRGCLVTSAVPSEAHAAVARAAFERAGAAATLVVAGEEALGGSETKTARSILPRSDLVIAYGSLERARDWRAALAGLAALARNALVVVAQNPDHWNARMKTALGRVRGERSVSTLDDPSRLETLAPELWKYGRVRAHTYFAGEDGGRALAQRISSLPLLSKVGPRAQKATSTLHAFVVDMRPRTPRERRRLAQVEEETGRRG